MSTVHAVKEANESAGTRAIREHERELRNDAAVRSIFLLVCVVTVLCFATLYS